MAKFSDEQKKIALMLFYGPKTVEELNKQLGIPFTKLREELRAMLRLDVIEKKGYPTKYFLKENISSEVRRRKELDEKDKNKIRLKAIIEVQAIEKELLKKQLKDIRALLEKDAEFLIYNIIEAKIVEQENTFSSFLDVNLSVKDFNALMKLMFLYGPSSVEVLKPEKLEIKLDDLQDALMLVANIVHGYTEFIAKKMTREEIVKFNEKLFG